MTNGQAGRGHRLYTAVVIVILFVCPALYAETNQQLEKITAKADRLELDQTSGVQILSGNVVITQGGISIFADRIQVGMRNGVISRIFGAGRPIRFQQVLADGQVVQTESDEIDYVTSSWTLVLRGDVQLQRGSWQLESPTIEYNVRTKSFSANGAAITEADAEPRDNRISITFAR